MDDAWLEFTPDNFDSFMLMLLRTAPANDDAFERAADESVRKRYAELKGWLPMTFEGRQAKLRNKIEVQRSYLLDNLYDGDLWAIGFRTLESGFDELARVPRHFFFTDYEGERDVRPKVYWAKGEVELGERSYFGIRVVVAQPAASKSLAPANEREPSPMSKRPAKKRQGGRTRTSGEIGEAARRLWDTQPGFRTLPLKLMVGEVHVALAPLDAADVSPIQVTRESKALLRHCFLFPKVPNPFAKRSLDPRRCRLIHPGNQSTSMTISTRTIRIMRGRVGK